MSQTWSPRSLLDLRTSDPLVSEWDQIPAAACCWDWKQKSGGCNGRTWCHNHTLHCHILRECSTVHILLSTSFIKSQTADWREAGFFTFTERVRQSYVQGVEVFQSSRGQHHPWWRGRSLQRSEEESVSHINGNSQSVTLKTRRSWNVERKHMKLLSPTLLSCKVTPSLLNIPHFHSRDNFSCKIQPSLDFFLQTSHLSCVCVCFSVVVSWDVTLSFKHCEIKIITFSS